MILGTGSISAPGIEGAYVKACWVFLVDRRHDMNIICVMLSVDMEAMELGCHLNVLGFDS